MASFMLTLVSLFAVALLKEKFGCGVVFLSRIFLISVGMEKKESSQPNKGKEQNNKGIQLCDAIFGLRVALKETKQQNNAQ